MGLEMDGWPSIKYSYRLVECSHRSGVSAMQARAFALRAYTTEHDGGY